MFSAAVGANARLRLRIVEVRAAPFAVCKNARFFVRFVEIFGNIFAVEKKSRKVTLFHTFGNGVFHLFVRFAHLQCQLRNSVDVFVVHRVHHATVAFFRAKTHPQKRHGVKACRNKPNAYCHQPKLSRNRPENKHWNPCCQQKSANHCPSKSFANGFFYQFHSFTSKYFRCCFHSRRAATRLCRAFNRPTLKNVRFAIEQRRRRLPTSRKFFNCIISRAKRKSNIFEPKRCNCVFTLPKNCDIIFCNEFYCNGNEISTIITNRAKRQYAATLNTAENERSRLQLCDNA